MSFLVVVAGAGAAPIVAKGLGVDRAQTLAFGAAAVSGLYFFATGSILAASIAIGAGVGGGVLLYEKKTAETKKSV